MALTSTQLDFLKKLAEAAKQDWEKNKIIIPSLTISQGIVESSWGSSDLSRLANNFFGIKRGNNWDGESVLFNSPEYVNGKRIMQKSPFRKYATFFDSVEDHSKFLKANKRYSDNGVVGCTDFVLACYRIKKAGYATGPNYGSNNIDRIIRYKLYEYDPEKYNPDKEYCIQFGAFRQEENAKSLVSTLTAMGIPVSYKQRDDQLFRVRSAATNNAVAVVGTCEALIQKNITHVLVAV